MVSFISGPPPPPPHLLRQRPPLPRVLPSSFKSKPYSPPLLSFSVQSPNPTAADEQSPSPPPSDAISSAVPAAMIPDDPQFRGCKTCGKPEIEQGCNGKGRIQGGIATVPGFGWWPIKAFRPCPGFVASGGRYKRHGQSMDEVASGGSRRRVGAA